MTLKLDNSIPEDPYTKQLWVSILWNGVVFFAKYILKRKIYSHKPLIQQQPRSLLYLLPKTDKTAIYGIFCMSVSQLLPIYQTVDMFSETYARRLPIKLEIYFLLKKYSKILIYQVENTFSKPNSSKHPLYQVENLFSKTNASSPPICQVEKIFSKTNSSSRTYQIVNIFHKTNSSSAEAILSKQLFRWLSTRTRRGSEEIENSRSLLFNYKWVMAHQAIWSWFCT